MNESEIRAVLKEAASFRVVNSTPRDIILRDPRNGVEFAKMHVPASTSPKAAGLYFKALVVKYLVEEYGFDALEEPGRAKEFAYSYYYTDPEAQAKLDLFREEARG